ncbi:Programmed cell death protein 6 [Cichlidogyrus casuarinus]|uniref:Programmed cell death protein 6 n=1 Tax=Cichlidogyrus casuarinus TaxID=1844966 RepID=A0ABD2QCG7_9PLAT
MANQNLISIFQNVDRDRSGHISESELQNALSNGTGTQFNPKCIAQMIKMFDTDGNGTINFEEFTQLFNYVQHWKNCFMQIDRDNSRSIDSNEFAVALQMMGYNLSPQFVQMLIKRFDRTRSSKIAFDDFIFACICLQMLTGSFAPLDAAKNGTATLTFEQFLTAAFVTVS